MAKRTVPPELSAAQPGEALGIAQRELEAEAAESGRA